MSLRYTQNEPHHKDLQTITVRVYWQELGWSANPDHTVYEFECMGKPTPQKNPNHWFIESILPVNGLPREGQKMLVQDRIKLRLILDTLLATATGLDVTPVQPKHFITEK